MSLLSGYLTPNPYASYHIPVRYTERLDKSLSTLYIAWCPGNHVRASTLGATRMATKQNIKRKRRKLAKLRRMLTNPALRSLALRLSLIWR